MADDDSEASPRHADRLKNEADTVMSAFPAIRVYLSEQFPTAFRGRGHLFGESVGRIFADGLMPFFMAPHAS